MRAPRVEARDPVWRCFVAVPIDDRLRTSLSAWVARLRASAGDEVWRWTQPKGWHVTLAFMGDTDPSRVPETVERLRRTASQFVPTTLADSGSGAFPSAIRARVLWYGFNDADDWLRALAHGVQAAAGLPPDERFRPHVTLARAHMAAGSDASDLLAAADPPRGGLYVDRIVLYRSHLGGGPARYEALATAQLRRSGA